MEISWMTTTVLGLIIIYLIYLKFFHKKENYWHKRGVHCKDDGTILETIKTLFINRKEVSDTIVTLYRENNGHKIFGYIIMNKPILMVRDPELINMVLIKDFVYFEDRNGPINEHLELLNAGLANLTGDKWRVLRHKLTPTFTSGKLKMMFKQIEDCSNEMVDFIKAKNGADMETRDFLFRFVINVIGTIAFGIKVDALNEEKDNEFLKMSKRFFTPSVLLQFKLVLFLVAPKLKEFLGVRMMDKEVNTFFPKLVQDIINHRKLHNEKRNDFLQLMINEKEKELASVTEKKKEVTDEQTSNSESNHDSIKEEEPEDKELLDQLKNLKCDKDSIVFSDNIIAAQAFLFISGGSETTAAVLSFAIHELAVHLDIQKKLQQEIDSVLSTQELDYESLKKMKYLEQFLYEVLRLRTQGGILTRMCVQDYKIPGMDVVIEKGTVVQIPVIGLHKDPQYFPDPDTFNPDRFEDMDAIPKGVFFPFGGGPRICIAMRLAMLEMKIFIATLLRSCNVLQSDKTPLPLIMDTTSFSQHVKGGLWVKFEDRTPDITTK